MVEITDRESAERWLIEQTDDTRAVLAARMAMRAIPWLVMERNEIGLGVLILRALRATLTSAVGVKRPSPEVRGSAILAANDVSDASTHSVSVSSSEDAASFVAEAAFGACYVAADHAAHFAAIAASTAASYNWNERLSHAEEAEDRTESAAAKAAAEYWSAFSSDATALEVGTQPDALFASPLWPKLVPEPVVAAWRDLAAGFVANQSFKFWARWYEAIRDGRPLNWEMQQDIALIDDDVWKAGPAAVAKAIALIEARYDGEPSPPDPDSVWRQVDLLLQNSVASEVSARSLAGLIETATREFREVCNDVPD